MQRLACLLLDVRREKADRRTLAPRRCPSLALVWRTGWRLTLWRLAWSLLSEHCRVRALKMRQMKQLCRWSRSSVSWKSWKCCCYCRWQRRSWKRSAGHTDLRRLRYSHLTMSMDPLLELT